MQESDKVEIKITAFVQKEENGYVSRGVENSVVPQGKTIEEISPYSD